MNHISHTNIPHIPWNKGKPMGQKLPLKLQQVWAIRIRLKLADHKRDLALFNLALDRKLRGCDLLSLRVSDLLTGDEIRVRAKVIQRKTGNAVQFEVTKQTREIVMSWIANNTLQPHEWLFLSRKIDSTVRYLGVEVEDTLELAESVEL